MRYFNRTTGEMYKFIALSEKVYSRISTWSTTKTTKIWNILKKNIKLASNSDYWKYVDDLAYPKFGLSTTTDYLKVFDDAFPNIRINMEIHHACPRAVWTRYRNLSISEKQMHSLVKLRGIPNNIFYPVGSTTKLHQHITNQWNSFYAQNSSITDINVIFAFAKQIDDQFGHLFSPPIRL